MALRVDGERELLPRPSRAVVHPQSAEHTVFGHAVREMRARRALSQDALGRASGLHRNYVGAIERGEINATLKVQLKLAAGLGFPLSELIALYERRRADHGLAAVEARRP